MASDFEDIRITGVDEKLSGGGDGRTALIDVVLTLSQRAPSDWSTYFNVRWKQNLYMMKRNAIVSGKHLTIQCVPDELEKDHLPELKKVVSETNQKYKEYLLQREREVQRERKRIEAQKAEIDKLKNIKFD